MSDLANMTEAAILRARRDPEFKQQLLTRSLDRLLAELHRQQRASASPSGETAAKLREAAALAARVADIIRELDEARHVTPRP